MASFDLSHAQVVALTLAPIVPGLLSFAASGTIVAMILRSPGKLSKPFRRIIFGISAYDVIQSFTASLSGFPSPSGSRWAAIGNDSTCTVQGFFTQLGVSGSPLYSLSLAIYYLCAIKFNMTDDQFQKRVEVYLHAVSNTLVWFSSIFLLVRGYFNVTITNCWISPYPSDCIHNPDVDCIRGEDAFRMQWLFIGYPVLIAFFANFIIMIMLVWNLYTLSRRMDRLASWRRAQDEAKIGMMGRISRRMSSMRSSISRPSNVESQIVQFEIADRSNGSLTFARPLRSNRTRSSGNSMEHHLRVQAISYLAASLFVYVFPYAFRILIQVNNSSPFIITFLARLTNPLQGFFNILIFTRTRVSTLRASSDYSWLHAFSIVVKSGVDHNHVVPRERRKTTLVASTRASLYFQSENVVRQTNQDRNVLPVESLHQAGDVKLQDENNEVLQQIFNYSEHSSLFVNDIKEEVDNILRASERRSSLCFDGLQRNEMSYLSEEEEDESDKDDELTMREESNLTMREESNTPMIEEDQNSEDYVADDIEASGGAIHSIDSDK